MLICKSSFLFSHGIYLYKIYFIPVMMTLPGINHRFSLRTFLSGKTMAKNRSNVTDNVARTDPRRNVKVKP